MSSAASRSSPPPRPSTASSVRTSSGSSASRGTRSPQDNLDLKQARKVPDEDHYDLDKVKERILEYLAVSKLKEGDLSGPILCFVGPPGVGKTSLGQSIARTLGANSCASRSGCPRRGRDPRPQANVHRRHAGHDHPRPARRRGEEPGLPDRRDRQVGRRLARRPGERDVEVLDPEQHSTFRDHYLDLPFDLSKVLFICTANQSRRSRPRSSTAWT